MAEDPITGSLDTTYPAHCEHGYADLTFQDVAAEVHTSTASVHYLYVSRDQLFGAFLDELCDFYSTIEPAHEAESFTRPEVPQ